MPEKKRTAEDRLGEYRRKRTPGATPEPFGSARSGAWGERKKAPVGRPRRFCVQKHAASSLHYDLRLEWNGVLLSWAVPKGPSLDPKDTRLAVRTEDHPLEYVAFEGLIPDGQYGAGAMIVWDQGLWTPLDDDVDGELGKGKLHFLLDGYKLHGEFYMVRPGGRSKPNEWLLKKKRDEHAAAGAAPFGEESVLSGLTVEELGRGATRRHEILSDLEEAGAPLRHVDPRRLELMLAEIAEAPWSSREWIFELKYDGYRVILAREAGKPFIRSRNGVDYTETFPEVSRSLGALPYDGLVLDGELCVLDPDGRPNFGRLQRRSQIRRKADVAQGAIDHPAVVFVFDLLAFEGRDVRPLALERRKELLRRVLPKAGAIQFTDHIEAAGEAMFRQVKSMGLEGIVAKKRDAPYRSGRVSTMKKIPVGRTHDFVVVGFTEPGGGRRGLGALHLGAYDGRSLVYVGRAGSGFTDEALVDYRAMLEGMITSEPEVTDPGAAARSGSWGSRSSGETHWVSPDLVAEVRYRTWTHDGYLRAPVFVRLRDDKSPRECVVPTARAEALSRGAGPSVDPDAVVETERAPAPPAPERTRREVKLTNLEKVFWPEESYTKGDLIAYYRSVGEHLLPYLVDRPLVLTRYPDGIDGKSFYQKNVPGHTPEWVRTISIYSDHVEREIEFYVCDDLETLLYVVQSGAIPLHIWPSRVATIQHPDFCLIDLDPKDAPFAHVVRLAKAIHELCEAIGLPSYVKTTGSSGLHILLPLGRAFTFEQSRTLGQLVAQHIESTHGDIATTRRTIRAREGKVYLDYLQNRAGQLLVAPYSVRPLPGAPVSAPLEWKEVNARLTPRKWTMANLPARLRKRARDPLTGVLDEEPDLLGVLDRLSKIVS